MMGLFDAFTKEGKLKKHARCVANKEALHDERVVSIHWLADEASPKAIYAILTRFDLKINQDIQDTNEKELAHDVLIRLGDAVIDPLYAFLKAARQHALPLGLLVELRGEQAAIHAVYDLLQREKGASFEPDRKRHLLVWLADHRDAGVIEAATPFLKDFDEGVRFAAAASILAQEDADKARSLLLPIVVDASEESLRLKHHIASSFVRRGWPVGEGVDLSTMPEPFVLHDGRILER